MIIVAAIILALYLRFVPRNYWIEVPIALAALIALSGCGEVGKPCTISAESALKARVYCAYTCKTAQDGSGYNIGGSCDMFNGKADVLCNCSNKESYALTIPSDPNEPVTIDGKPISLD